MSKDPSGKMELNGTKSSLHVSSPSCLREHTTSNVYLNRYRKAIILGLSLGLLVARIWQARIDRSIVWKDGFFLLPNRPLPVFRNWKMNMKVGVGMHVNNKKKNALSLLKKGLWKDYSFLENYPFISTNLYCLWKIILVLRVYMYIS